jgi:opacity protein-like surface antigen
MGGGSRAGVIGERRQSNVEWSDARGSVDPEVESIRMRKSTKTAAFLAVAAALLVLAPPAAHAQGGMRFSPWVGLYAPTRDFGSVQAVEFGKHESTFSFGGDLDIGVRIGAGYATNSDVPISGVGCTACDARFNVLAMTGALVIRPLPLPGIRPYALAGGGIKWYDFNHDNVGVNALLNDQQRFTFQFGAGVVLAPDSPLGLFAEVSDYVSRFDFDDEGGQVQHDLFFKVGLSFLMGVPRPAS